MISRQASIDSIEAGLTTTEQYIQNNGSEVVKALLKVYADRLTGIADSYVAYTDNAVSSIKVSMSYTKQDIISMHIMDIPSTCI